MSDLGARGPTSPRDVALGFYDAFNARDYDRYLELLDEEVEVSVDSYRFVGRRAVVGYVAGIHATFPGVVGELERVVATSPTSVVVEKRLVNPGPADGRQEDDGWFLGGRNCEVVDVRGGKIVRIHSYYAPSDEDRTASALVPSRNEASRIGDDQAALRRVATLVANGAAEEIVFAAVNQEIARLVSADVTSLMRFEQDDTLSLLAAWDTDGTAFPIGERQPIDDELRAVRDTGRTSRFGPPEVLPDRGPFVEHADALGLRSSVGVPIAVDGVVWGISFAAVRRPEPFPEDTEARISGFTELVATALANAQANAALRELASEQAALRRVAELAARGADPDTLFGVVAAEASELLSGLTTTLHRFGPEGESTIVAVEGTPTLSGTRTTPNGGLLPTRVWWTGRPERVDDGTPGASGVPGARYAVGVPISVDGRVWGLLGAGSDSAPVPAGTEQRLGSFAELVAIAIANTESRAALTTSRARVVASADEARRRVQRDVHDGAQQRLVQTVVTLKLARAALTRAEDPVAELLDESLHHAQRASIELRDVVRGIMPVALVRGGLHAGISSLIADLSVPVDIDVDVPRLATALETTAYFVVAEALTNVVKHAKASRAHVRVVLEHGTLHLDIADDGCGGADAGGGTGLTGLADRVAAGEGTLIVQSPPGQGTSLQVRLPAHPAVA